MNPRFQFKKQSRLPFQKKAFSLAVLSVIFLGCFLRAYHFSDWLHFELDQARDANVISKAMESGIGELPLLGPRAGGTYLRLGPAFYYLEYASARILGNTPPGIAAVVLFFSVASLGLFYLLVRRFFDRNISLGLLAVYASSFFLVMYSRFAWNPNLIPFFSMLFFYAILRTADKDERRKGWWLTLAALTLAILTQLHFLAFIAFPLIALIFMAYERPRIGWRFWLASVSIATLLYFPVALNELKTGGENALEFKKAVMDKGDKKPGSFEKKIAVDYFEQSRYYFLTISGQSGPGFFRGEERKPVLFDTPCEKDCKNNIFLSLLGLVWLSFSLAGFLSLWKKEKEPSKKTFLALFGLSFGIIFLVFVPLSLDLSPRFFLLLSPMPFILLGINLVLIKKLKRGYFWPAIIMILLFSNLRALKDRFGELAQSSRAPVNISQDWTLKEKNRVTYRQETAVAGYMESFAEKNGQPVFYMGPPQYLTAFGYILEKNAVLFGRISKNNIYKNGNYFYIINNNKEGDDGSFLPEEYREKFDVGKIKPFGSLSVVSLTPRAEAITEESKDFSKDKEKRSSAPRRYTWNEIITGSESDSPDDSEED